MADMFFMTSLRLFFPPFIPCTVLLTSDSCTVNVLRLCTLPSLLDSTVKEEHQNLLVKMEMESSEFGHSAFGLNCKRTIKFVSEHGNGIIRIGTLCYVQIL